MARVQSPPRRQAACQARSLHARQEAPPVPVTTFAAPRPIREDDSVAAFSCGSPPLDSWLRTRAKRNELEGASRTYVVVHQRRVIAYYSLATAAVPHASATGRFRRNMPDPIPGILLARL